MSTDSQTLPARLTNLTAADVYGDQEALEDILTEIETTARSIAPPDVSTKAGREAISSLAYKVARSKTFLDEKLGKPLVADWKAKAAAVDKLRKRARDRLDALKAVIRQPLTDYEQAEADRQARIAALIGALGQMPPDDPFTDAATLQARIAELEAVEIGEDYAERADEARQVKAATLYALGKRLEASREREAVEAAAEAERVERERLAREAREQRIAAEAAEQATREAEQAAAAEQQRQEQALIDAEQREREARAAQQRAEQAAAEATQRAASEAEQAAERERARIAAEQARQREAEARRAADREHQAQIHREIFADLCDLGIAEATARSLIGAIARGGVAHLTIAY